MKPYVLLVFLALAPGGQMNRAGAQIPGNEPELREHESEHRCTSSRDSD